MNNVKIIEIETNNSITLYLQIILIILLAIFGVITLFFDENMLKIVYFILSGLLALMAWNNHKFYKRKYVSIIYIAFALLTFVSGILELI